MYKLFSVVRVSGSSDGTAFLYKSENYAEVLAYMLNGGGNRFSIYVLDNGDMHFISQNTNNKNYIIKKE